MPFSALFVLPLACQGMAFALGLMARGSRGWILQIFAAAFPPLSALSLLWLALWQVEPCPPDAPAWCGEGTLQLLFIGLVWAAVNLLLAIGAQLAVRAWWARLGA